MLKNVPVCIRHYLSKIRMYSHIYLCKCIRDSQYFPNHSGSSYEADINVLKTTGYEAWRYPCTGSRIYFVDTSAPYSGVHYAIIDTRPSKSNTKFSSILVQHPYSKLVEACGMVDSNPNRFIDSNSESMIEFHDVESIELSIGLWRGGANITQWAP